MVSNIRIKSEKEELQDYGVTFEKVDDKTYLSQMASNIVPSGKKFVIDTLTPFFKPVETAKNLGQLGKSIYTLVVDSDDPDAQLAKDVGQFFADRYGGIDAIKETIKNDPVGFLGDASIILTGGAMLSARIPSQTANVVARAMTATGNVIDPLTLSARVVANPMTKFVANNYIAPIVASGLGLTTQAGRASIETAYQAGKAGGEQGQAFQSAMRGADDAEKLVTDAIGGMKNLQDAKKATYQSGMTGLQLGRMPVDITKVEKMLEKFKQQYFPKDRNIIGEAGTKQFNRIEKAIDEFLQNPNAHTIEDLDILKQEIFGDFSKFPEGQSGRVITEMGNGIKNIILEQAPDYANVMKAYEDASAMERNISQATGIFGNSKATNMSTALRKLQQSTKDGVLGNQGQKLSYVERLDQANPNAFLKEQIAGSALNTITPRGIQGSIMGALPSAGLAFGASTNPFAYLGLASASPRAMGELAYYTGKASNMPITNIGKYGTPSLAIPRYDSLTQQYIDAQNDSRVKVKGLLD